MSATERVLGALFAVCGRVSVLVELGVGMPGSVDALLAAEGRVLLVVFDSLERPVRTVSVEVEPPSVFFAFPLPFLLSGCIFKSLRVSIGKSATPIIICVAVPIRAVAPPEIGSQGPSSVSYSRGRHLYLVSTYHIAWWDVHTV